MDTSNLAHFKAVKKRDGKTAPFDSYKITYAVERAMEAAKEGHPNEDAPHVSEAVILELKKISS